MLTDALQGLRRRRGIRRYMTLARHVYGAPFLLRPTDAACVPIHLIHTMALSAAIISSVASISAVSVGLSRSHIADIRQHVTPPADI
jgi:hypothetical protein